MTDREMVTALLGVLHGLIAEAEVAAEALYSVGHAAHAEYALRTKIAQADIVATKIEADLEAKL